MSRRMRTDNRRDNMQPISFKNTTWETVCKNIDRKNNKIINMNKLTILIIMLLALTKAYAQQISGKVMNEKDMPMEYASVALINTADSSLIS